MDRNEIIHTLAGFVRLDLDAVLAYGTALEAIEDGNIAEFFESFEDDHEQHVHDLSAAILHYGGQPPMRRRESKGWFLEGMARIVGKSEMRATLLAIQQSEALAHRAYEAALAADLPLEAKDIVQRNFGDEKRHQAFVDAVLAGKLWESPGKLRSLDTLRVVDETRGTTA
jgi:uncharacterized protein (TIGR02284 family)